MTRLEKRIISEIDKANEMWQLFTEDDPLLLAVSGGKDSMVLWHLMQYYPVRLKGIHIRLSPRFKIDFINQNNLEDQIEVIETDIYDKIKGKESSLNTCFICSRERRKEILKYAEQRGFLKIIFGHHRNDVVETLLLNLFFSREISTLLPQQELFRGKFKIIRPLYTVDEKLLISLHKEKGWYLDPPGCKEAESSKRNYVRKLLAQLEAEHPQINIRDNIFSSLQSVKSPFLPFPIREEI